VKFGEGRPITVTVRRAADDTASVSVRDRGVGVASADVPRLFEAFERGASARHIGGLGLGLYIAREVARAHGGDIAVESAPGAGALFVLHLPTTTRGKPAAAST